MTARAIAKIDTTSVLVSGDFDDMKAKAQTMIRSGLLPYSIKTPEQFIVIAFHAVELGLPVMYAMRHIAVINGNPTADAQAMAGIIENDFGDNAIVVTEQTTDHATVRVMKPGWDEPQFVTYTMKEAVDGKVNRSWDKDKKEWVEKHAWRSHPTDMLRSRAVSRAARTYFPASIGGLYTPEELGADVTVNDDGSMQIVEVTPNGHGEWVESKSKALGAGTIDQGTGEIVDATPSAVLPHAWLMRLVELATSVNVSIDQLDAESKSRYGVAHHENLTTDQATEIAAWLMSLADSEGGDEPLPEADPDAISEQQIKAVHAIGRNLDLDHDALNEQSNATYGRPIKALTKAEASAMIDALQQQKRSQG